MKRTGRFVACLVTAAVFMVGGCGNLTMIERKSDRNTEYGSLTIKSDLPENNSRMLDVNRIASAKVSVGGFDISSDQEPCAENVIISNGKNASAVTIENIPVGVRRIVTVLPYDSEGNLLENFVRRAVTDINKGSNTISVNKSTTAKGNVYYRLRETGGEAKFPAWANKGLENDDQYLRGVDNIFDTDDTLTKIHPCLVDVNAIAGDIDGNQIPYVAANYVMTTKTVTLDYIIANNFTVEINDPVSETLTGQNAANGITVSNVAPGNWTLYIKDSSGNVLDSQNIYVSSKEDLNIGHVEHNGIAVLVRQSLGYNYLHYWGVEGSTAYKATTWPGIELTEKVSVVNPTGDTGKSDTAHQDFYVFDFKGCTSVELLSTNSSGGKYCSSDMTADSKGVWCVHSSGIVKRCIDDTPAPEVPLFTDAEKAKCYKDIPESKGFYLVLSSSKAGGSGKTVKAKFAASINDTSLSLEISDFTYDSDQQLYYSFIPYKKVRATNQSGQPCFRFYVDGSVKSPSSLVESGYIYTKFENGENKFQVVIFDRQDETKVKQRLADSVNYKYKSDFDLTTEDGKMGISNFRGVPGTTNMYRSFHPYYDSKSGIPNDETARARMSCLTELAEKYGICADIDLAYSSIQGASYGSMPDYYQNIINNGKVLFMTDCGYNVCYESSNSSTFYGGVKKIIDFVNSTEGPYLIHCAIGTDRTGVMCGIIGVLCGADWSDIAEDYCASVNMGIREYRGEGCVKYSVEQFLGIEDLCEYTTEQLQEMAVSKMVEKTSLSESDVQQFISTLNE